jgi:hypothetical protein
VDQPQDDPEENISASGSEIDTGINFSNLPQPGSTSDDSSLRHEMRNMTAVLAQLVTRLDSQDMKLNQLQMNYNSKFETIQQCLHIPSNLVGAQPSAVTTNQAAIDSNTLTHTQAKTNTNPTLQQFRNDQFLGQLADRQLSSLKDDDLGMLQNLKPERIGPCKQIVLVLRTHVSFMGQYSPT